MKRLLALAFAGFALAACSTFGIPAPQSPAQTVYAAKGDFAAALTIANQYAALPRCGTPSAPPLCSESNIVQNVNKAAHAADASLDAAEATVRDPAFSNNSDAVSKAVAAATNAVAALQAVTSTLKTQ